MNKFEYLWYKWFILTVELVRTSLLLSIPYYNWYHSDQITHLPSHLPDSSFGHGFYISNDDRDTMMLLVNDGRTTYSTNRLLLR